MNMRLATWLPWKYIVRRAARTHGFVDPIALVSHLHQFAQPSEVSEPIELLRAGMVFHARGLINTRAIQHNLDWVWPYWVNRQFDPLDHSFIPRALSLTHINLTHRNWTAVGIPGCRAIPIVDPRGLVTPFFDGWSIDGWILTEDGNPLLPSNGSSVLQRLVLDQDNLSIITETRQGIESLRVEASVVAAGEQGLPVCRINFQALIDQQMDQRIDQQGAECQARRRWLVIALRPYNPEGVSFIRHVALSSERRSWIINKKQCVTFNTLVERHAASRYRDGDVYLSLPDAKERESVECDVGLATAAALFQLQPNHEPLKSGESGQSGQSEKPEESEKSGKPLKPLDSGDSREPLDSRKAVYREVSVDILLSDDKESVPLFAIDYPRQSWSDTMKGLCRLCVPDRHFQFLYEAALRTLILHSPGDVYPGPYTYKRFWFRDAAFILQAMLCAGMKDRVLRAVKRFSQRQTGAGFFRSQAGEWDSNGEALWIIRLFCESAGIPPQPSWVQSIIKGGRWIKQKRLADNNKSFQAGLLPAGFSAEHLGPNDYYYWDDFWSVAGLRAAASMLRSLENSKAARVAHVFDRESDALMQAIERSLERSWSIRSRNAIPASPYRRMDAGAIGSIVVSYPLRLWTADDHRVLSTVDYLISNCFVHGAFFQDMVHSGINAYLTLHLAQVLLRAADSRFYDLVRAIADLASPTGQWPEAIHPITCGGCMGDGQHVWAAAEWIMMMRNMFVREEGDRLVLASGIVPEWLDQPQVLELGPTLTPHGGISLRLQPHPQKVVITWQASWLAQAPVMEVRIPGLQPRIIDASAKTKGEKIEIARL
jgi:hypothetical protein